MLAWFKILWIFIYLISCSTNFSFITVDFFTIFIENNMPVFLCLAIFTIPNFPLPNYLPT